MSYLNFSWILPGALAGAQGPTSHRDLVFFQRNDIRAIVRMQEGTVSGEAWKLVDLYEPVPSAAAPGLDQIDRMVGFIEEQIETWERPVVVTCQAGLGRTGTVLACYMVSVGYAPGKAIAHVRQLRPGSLQMPEQERTVHQYSARLKLRQREAKRQALEDLPDR